MSVNEIIKKMTTCLNGDCHECEYSELPDYECEDKLLEETIKVLNEVNDIVHCKDCVYRSKNECYMNHDRHGNRRFVTDGGYCEYGETNGNV